MMLELRMRQYPRVPTSSPSLATSGDECDNTNDPAAARQAHEHTKICKLRETVRRGGGAGGLRTMRTGVTWTTVNEDAMWGDVQIDEEEGMGKHPPTDERLHWKAVSAGYLHADDDHECSGGEAPSHATKNLDLVVAHAVHPALERNDADAELGLSDHKVKFEWASLVLPPPPHLLDWAPEAVPGLKASAKPKPKFKTKEKSKTNPTRGRKTSYEYTDNKDDGHEEEVVHKDLSALVPGVAVYMPSSDDADIDMLGADGVDVDLDGDEVHRKADMDVDKTDTKLRAKVALKKMQQKNDDSDDDRGRSGAGPTTAKSNTKRTSSSKPQPKSATSNLPWSTEEHHHLHHLEQVLEAGGEPGAEVF